MDSADDLDEDVLNSMNCLGCFKDREKLIEGLLLQKYVLAYILTISKRKLFKLILSKVLTQVYVIFLI